jgi:hypothetical protein
VARALVGPADNDRPHCLHRGPAALHRLSRRLWCRHAVGRVRMELDLAALARGAVCRRGGQCPGCPRIGHRCVRRLSNRRSRSWRSRCCS